MRLQLQANELLPSDPEIRWKITEETGFYQLIMCAISLEAVTEQLRARYIYCFPPGPEPHQEDMNCYFPLSYSMIWRDLSFCPSKL